MLYLEQCQANIEYDMTYRMLCCRNVLAQIKFMLLFDVMGQINQMTATELDGSDMVQNSNKKVFILKHVQFDLPVPFELQHSSSEIGIVCFVIFGKLS